MPKHSFKKLSLLVIAIIFVLSFASSCAFSPKQQESLVESESERTVSSESIDNQPSFQWPSDNAFVENITPFSGGKIVDIEPKVNSVLITIVSVEESAFKLYVNTLKQLGFTEVIFENDLTYSAVKPDSTNGKREGITVSYNKDNSKMTIDASVEIEG